MDTATHTNHDAAAVGAALRTIRTSAGLTISDVAARVGVNKSTISRIEAGKRSVGEPLRTDILQAIVNHLLATSGRAA